MTSWMVGYYIDELCSWLRSPWYIFARRERGGTKYNFAAVPIEIGEIRIPKRSILLGVAHNKGEAEELISTFNKHKKP